MNTVWIEHAACARHENAAQNPEVPARIEAIAARAEAVGLTRRLAARLEAPRASREQLERAHARAYVDHLHAVAPAGDGRVHLDYDTSMDAHTLEAALRAAGAAVLATDVVCTGRAGAAFCNVRPPGHHAERERAMGFCLFANTAIAALHARAAHGLERVAVFDFDVHHGNGTEQILRGRTGVMMASLYQCPLYPNQVAAAAQGHMVNVALAPGSGRAALRAAWTSRWAPALAAFAPQLLVVSAGFDAHRRDPLGSLDLEAQDYAWLTRQLAESVQASGGRGVVSVLEGGYDLEALAESACAHVEALIDA